MICVSITKLTVKEWMKRDQSLKPHLEFTLRNGGEMKRDTKYIFSDGKMSMCKNCACIVPGGDIHQSRYITS